ncbi:hypothetical protein QQX98_004092 [Neonectria punicea]|uniref:AAA+ ATPase domain-containing protein n=1 Tax=Neonectria punicea TaxID=979145 RepID=A0ABR1HB08_9HYPO
MSTMLLDDDIPPPQPPSPSSIRKDSLATIPGEQSPDHGLPAQRANSDSPTKLATVPALDPTSSQSSESSIEPVKEKDGRPPPTKPTEQEQTQLAKLEKTEDSAGLKAQIQRLNDRLREVEESGRSKKDPEPEDPELDEDSNFEQWEGVSSRHANESQGGLSLQRNHRPKAHEEMMASGALMAEFEFNARMEAHRHGRHLHHPGYNARDDTYHLEQATGEEAGPEEGSNAIPLNTSQLNHVPWETFQRLLEESPFAIDVLVGEPEPKVTPMFPHMLQPTAPTRARQAAQAAQPKEGGAVPVTKTPTIPIAMPSNHAQRSKMPGKPVARGQAPLPERIRINSPAIIKLLHEISEMGDEDESQPDEPNHVLMMQPFRALVYYKDEIRNWKARLEAEVKEPARAKTPEPEAGSGKEEEPEDNDRPDAASQDGDISKPQSDAGSEPENQPAEDEKQSDLGPILNTQKAVDDITCLVEFIDNELEGRIAYLASNDCQRVAFSDIWLLFKPGDLVLSKDGKQTYRVTNVEYSKHSMKPPSPRDLWMYGAKARLEDFPIKIQCVYVDFDGEQIGPVLQTFSFHRFEGEKNVRSLDILPLRLAKNVNKLQETLIKRGSTFIEACGTGRHGIPMHYSGLTLDTKEEVDSQVVIDFEEAFAVHDGNNRNAKRPGVTTEQVILEILAQECKDKIRNEGNGLIVLQDLDSMALNWKPVIKDIDAQESKVDHGYVTDSDSDSDTFRSRARRPTKTLDCIPECCANEIVYDDTYVEHRRSNEFIRDQFREQGTGSLAISSRPLEEAMEDGDFIRDSERLIITYRVFGFIMRSRKWAQLDLTYLGPAKGENTFDLLVLPPGHRNMVESLVTQHYLDMASASDETDEMDIVRGKGKGLIILLHGAPGVGKTTTAECVATYFQKPLFQITCGDLGSTADAVEHRLEKSFALASRWGCILLIDEADVFLEARQTENFDRNSLVAVFLRTLEYYTGILFLTTNRVGTFDEAFTSRIHISLYYPPLDLASTLAVFKVNLDRIKERFRKKKQRGIAELELDERSIDKFIVNYYDRQEEARWNGRQIRNACQTALALAEFEAQKAANPGVAGGRSVMDIVAASSKMIKVRMTAKHFHDVAKAYLAFMKYLREVHGMSAAQQARSFRLRHDRYGLGESTARSGLLASRQRGNAGGGGGGRQRKPVQKQGLWRRGMQRPSLGVDDGYIEEDLGEYEYGEEDLYGEGQDEDVMLDEREEEEEEEVEEDLEDKQEEDPEEDVGDDADFGALEDEQAAEEDEDKYWEERLQEDNRYLYEAQPKARPQPAGGGRGFIPRGRGQQQTKYKAVATAHPRADGLGRGKWVATAAGRSSGLPGKAPRGDRPPLGPGRGKGMGTAARGRNPRVATRHE